MGVYDVLESITVSNWYCGEISALYAWSNNCTIENISEQNTIRRELKKIGYNCSIVGCIITRIFK